MNSENGEKFVFELKDLSYADLISLYNDILDFNNYLDETFKSVNDETIAPVEENLPEKNGEESNKEEAKEEEKA